MSVPLEQPARIAEGWVRDGATSAVAVEFGRVSGAKSQFAFGRQRLAEDAARLRDDGLFVVASITKPVVAMTVLSLVEEGLLSLSDRVARFVPAFGANGKQSITIRHLLTHTSGLPDMLPHNRALRERNAPLDAFVEGTNAISPDFQPGRGVQYQSMGFAMLAAVAFEVTGTKLPDLVRDRVTEPLGMAATFLGMPNQWYEDGGAERIVELAVPVEQQSTTGWGWNSRYWHEFGAPWGGLLSTPVDLGRFARAMLADGDGVWSPATIAAATANRLHDFADLPETDRRCRPWGLGWRLNWVAHTATFGDLLGPRAYGHFGATGTMLWIDPDLDAYAVVLTTTPFDPRRVPLARLSNAIVAALG